jgi:hypothetical protein
MSLSDRVAKLERDASPPEALRVVYVAEGADKAAEHDRQRQQERYHGPLAILDETDRNL